MAHKDRHCAILPTPRALDDLSKWIQLREKMKAFRLKSLRFAPEAFASTYADEILFADDVWEKRMTNPLALHFVAVDTPAEKGETTKDGIETLLQGEWLSMLVVIGPKEDGTDGVHASQSPWDSTKPKAVKGRLDIAQSESVPLYQLNGVFTIPKARGQGIGKKLVNASVAATLSAAKEHGLKDIWMQVRVEVENEPAKALYSSCGFAEVGREAYMTREKERDGIKIPPRTGTAIVMQRVEKVA